jgi:hypothetical protein
MASSLQKGKQSVDLAAPGKLGSRIRRDPPPKVKEISVEELKERERRRAIVGVMIFALALFVIILGFSAFAGWSPAAYTIHLNSL